MYTYIYIYCFVFDHGIAVRICQFSQEFEALKDDESVKFPEQHMLRTMRRKECYQGCFSKWQKQRILYGWDAFVQVAPTLAKTKSEIPNSFRNALNVSVKKWNGSRFKRGDGLHTIPDPLALATESMLLDAMSTGQEIGMNFVMKTMNYMVSLWNEHMKDIRDHIEQLVKNRREAGDHVESCRPIVGINNEEISCVDPVKKMFDTLQFCNIQDSLEARQLLVCFSFYVFDLLCVCACMQIEYGLVSQHCWFRCMIYIYIYIYTCACTTKVVCVETIQEARIEECYCDQTIQTSGLLTPIDGGCKKIHTVDY